MVALFALEPLKRVPSTLVVIVLGIALSHFKVFDTYGIAVVGEVQMVLSAPGLPDLSRDTWLRIGELAFALMLILYAESYTSIRNFALLHQEPIDANRDLRALGIGNLLSGLAGGMTVGAGFSATAANESAGAQSRLAGLFAAAIVLGAVLTLLPWIGKIPEPVLAAVVIHAVSHALKPSQIKPYFIWRRDRLIVVTALVAVLALGVLHGLLLAIAVSLVMALRGFSRATVAELGHATGAHSFLAIDRHPDLQRVPGLLIVRPEAPLFFANIDRVVSNILTLV